MAQTRWVLLPCQRSLSAAQRVLQQVPLWGTAGPSVKTVRGAEVLQAFCGEELLSYAAVGNSGILGVLGLMTFQADASGVSQLYSWYIAGLPRARDQAPQLTGLQSTRCSDTVPVTRRFVACPWGGPARPVPGRRPGHDPPPPRAGPRSPALLLPVHVEAPDGRSVPHIVPSLAPDAICGEKRISAPVRSGPARPGQRPRPYRGWCWRGRG